MPDCIVYAALLEIKGLALEPNFTESQYLSLSTPVQATSDMPRRDWRWLLLAR